jgi:hypothetical protein
VNRITPVDVIGQPFAFTQQRLLDVREFERATSERGVPLSPGDLERLHRAGILVPLFAVRRPQWDIHRRLTIADYLKWTSGRIWNVPKDGQSLREDLDAGLVRSGRSVRFRPWASDRVGTHHGAIARREYLYSRYQLLDLPSIERAMPLLRRPASELTRWQRRELRHLRENAVQTDDLVALLEALEPRYLPDIVRHYRSRIGADEERPKYVREFDPVAALRDSRWSADQVYEAGAGLIHRADMHDPLRHWLDLVRQVHPDKWQRLRGPALLAIELRIAAEMAFRFLEDLQDAAAAPRFPEIPKLAPHELNSRLLRDRSELDPVLMDFDLSPYPAVVLALEGPTEMEIVPLVMEAMGIPQRQSFIRLVDSGSEDRDHGFLAQYVALPALGPREGDNAPFERPPTHYLIAVDGDRGFRDLAAREREHQKWVGVLFHSLPAEYQTAAARDEIASMVTVEAWADGLDFERAHFTDAELAASLIATGLMPPILTEADLSARLAHGRQTGTSLKAVWADWPNKPRKPDVARLAWPALADRIADAVSDDERLRQIPVARVLLKAFDLAIRTPRRHVIFRVGTRSGD